MAASKMRSQRSGGAKRHMPAMQLVAKFFGGDETHAGQEMGTLQNVTSLFTGPQPLPSHPPQHSIPSRKVHCAPVTQLVKDVPRTSNVAHSPWRHTARKYLRVWVYSFEPSGGQGGHGCGKPQWVEL